MGDRPLVIVSHRLPEEWLAPLAAECELLVGPDSAETDSLTPELQQRLPDADGLLSMLVLSIDEAFLANAPRLKVISNLAVGVDNIDLAAATAAGVPIGHTPGVLTNSTADLVMAILLSAARRLPEAAADAKAGKWTTWGPTNWLGAEFNGATLGIVGFGQIGQAVAQRAQGFGVNLVYHSRTRKPSAETAFGARWLPLPELYAQADFVVMLVPLSAETRHMVDAEALRQMKPSAILVNAARGPIVDTEALLTALREGWIAGAALDVTDPEPLPPDHPLYQLSNCLITPHIGSSTWHTRRAIAERACTNLLAGLRSQRLPFCANPAVYDAQ